MCEPIVDLEHVGQHLRTGHELPVPGLPIVGRAVYKCVDFLGIQQAVDWRIGIGQDFFQLAAKHFFVCGVVCFRVGALLDRKSTRLNSSHRT